MGGAPVIAMPAIFVAILSFGCRCESKPSVDPRGTLSLHRHRNAGIGMSSRADYVITEALRRRRSVEDKSAIPAPEYVEQPQDHFDKTNTNTWQQAFYVNDKYWKGPQSEAPIFICVGGEGPPLDGSVVVDSVHCNVAVEWLPETGALMLALEHRYVFLPAAPLGQIS